MKKPSPAGGGFFHTDTEAPRLCRVIGDSVVLLSSFDMARPNNFATPYDKTARGVRRCTGSLCLCVSM